MENTDDEQYAYRVVDSDGNVLNERLLIPLVRGVVAIAWHWQKPISILYRVVRFENKTVIVQPYSCAAEKV
jgi:hypothetical protein